MYVKFQVLTVAYMKVIFFCVAPCSVVEVDGRFRGAYYRDYQGGYIPVTVMTKAVRISETSVYFYQKAVRILTLTMCAHVLKQISAEC
jgi:hypothetical protein